MKNNFIVQSFELFSKSYKLKFYFNENSKDELEKNFLYSINNY